MTTQSAAPSTFCGIAVDRLGPIRLMEVIGRAVGDDRLTIVGHHNLHSLALVNREHDAFHGFFDLVDASFVDGMSMVAVSRLCGGDLRREDRATVLDWIWLLLGRAEVSGWSVYHLGGDDATIATATRKIRARHPDLRLTTRNGFFDAELGSSDNRAVLEHLADVRPDVLLVGMGMPRQEAWVADNIDRLPPTVIVTVGGILGYLGEERATPPRWMGRVGLEWLARLADEPTRLGPRYLMEPVPLVPVIARGIAHERFGSRRWYR